MDDGDELPTSAWKSVGIFHMVQSALIVIIVRILTRPVVMILLEVKMYILHEQFSDFYIAQLYVSYCHLMLLVDMLSPCLDSPISLQLLGIGNSNNGDD
jgi:hypothetical protein